MQGIFRLHLLSITDSLLMHELTRLIYKGWIFGRTSVLKLVRYLKGYGKQCVLAPLFKFLEAIFNLLVPIVMASVVDDGIAKGDVHHIYLCAAILIGMAVIGWVCAATAQYFCAQLASGFGTGLRNDLFKHIMSLSRADIDELGSATLITRVTNDTNQIQDGVNMFFRLVLRCPIAVIGSIISAYIISGIEGAIVLVSCLFVLLFVWLIMRVAIVRYRNVQTALDNVLLSVTEQLEGVRVLRAFSRESAECEAFDQTTTGLRQAQVHAGDAAALMNPLTYVSVNLALVAMLWVGGIQVDTGIFTQGELVALVNYMSQLLVEVLKIATFVNMLSKAAACSRRVNEIFEHQPTMVDGTESADGASASIEFKSVSFAYPEAGAPTLKDISFSAKPGDVIGIIGGTGSGKSTLANLIMRLYDTTEGTVLVGGKDIRTYSLKSLHHLVSMVDQKPHMFSGTIESNLKLADENATEQQLIDAISTAQATDAVEAKGGLSAKVEQLGRNMSGGQRQRLSIARTLTRSPRILILDDASSALDLATDAALRHALAELPGEVTQVVISQRVSAIRHANTILVLDEGKLVGKGTHKELLGSCEVYREICDSQLEREEVEA